MDRELDEKERGKKKEKRWLTASAEIIVLKFLQNYLACFLAIFVFLLPCSDTIKFILQSNLLATPSIHLIPFSSPVNRLPQFHFAH